MALQFPSPSPLPGCDVALLRQDDTGKFDLDFSRTGKNKGNSVLDNTRTHAVLTTLISWKRGRRPQSQVEEGGYYLDTTGQRGTLIWTVTQDKMATRSDLIAFADDGGTQLQNLNYLSSFAASAERRSIANYRLNFRWTTPQSTYGTTLTF
jgi:hypothetical protein